MVISYTDPSSSAFYSEHQNVESLAQVHLQSSNLVLKFYSWLTNKHNKCERGAWTW